MTNERTARLCGDPPYRADAYADDLAAIERDRAEQQERIDADPDWRTGRERAWAPRAARGRAVAARDDTEGNDA